MNHRERAQQNHLGTFRPSPPHRGFGSFTRQTLLDVGGGLEREVCINIRGTIVSIFQLANQILLDYGIGGGGIVRRYAHEVVLHKNYLAHTNVTVQV